MKNSFPRMHVSLYVSNIEKTVSFYEAFFSQKAEKVKPGYAKFILDAPALIISFVENKERIPTSYGHLGFQLETEEDLTNYKNTVTAKNIEIVEEIGTSCCYAVQDKFWAKDPDGYNWEVYYFHEDAEFNDIQYTASSNEVCCMPDAEVKIEVIEKKKVNLADLNKEAASCEPSSGCC
jgi:predicted enzyme related to lactoylglutathione lyase